MRSILNTSLSIGMVSIPVKVYSATSSHDLALHQFHEADAGRIRYRKVCEIDDDPVPDEEIIKGVETETGLAVVDDDDLAGLPVTSKIIEVAAFVPAEQVDPVYYEKSYYLGPGDGGSKSFALLREAMAQAGRVALAQFTMRQRQSLATIRPYEDTLVLDTLAWADEVRIPDLKLPDTIVEAELEMAKMLIDASSGDWDPEPYTDAYQQALAELIDAKAHGRKAPAPAKERKATVTSIMDALEQSLAQAGKQPPPPKKAARKRAAKKTAAKRNARKATAGQSTAKAARKRT